MSVLNENQKMGASGAGGEFEIEQSLRFEESRGSNLERTPAADSNRRTWTFSGWFKLGNLNARKVIFGARKSDTNPSQDYTSLYYESDGTFKLYSRIGNVTQLYCITNAKFRDPSAWYHIVAVIDTTQGTASNRAKLYVNNDLQSFSTATMPAQNYYTWVNNNFKHFIGSNPAYDNSTNHMYDGYMGEVNFIDGQALTPSSFGETGKYGEWKPIEVDGITYGTNGFYLPFKQDYTVEGFSTVVFEANTQVRYVGAVGFQPDFLWFKNRTRSSPHRLVDTLRGLPKTLTSNTTGAEATGLSDGTVNRLVTGVTADGFTLGIDDGGYRINSVSGDDIVAWTWDMGGTTASNTDGTITTSVRANTTYGQSIVSWTGNATNNTKLGHGLGSTPEIVIVKSRTTAAPWKVGGSVIQAVYGDGSNNSAFLSLNTTAAADQETTGFQGNTATTIGVGANSDTNSNGATYIAYAFHSVTGYSKFSSYSGNGSTTGPTVALGFSPAFLMVKCSSSTEPWTIVDSTRNPTNPRRSTLAASSSAAKVDMSAGTGIDFTSTGFQVKTNIGNYNASGQTYIYMAFADTREYAYWLDQSGNNNDWTSEGGLTESDVMVDSPTNNFATFNPLIKGGADALTEGNLKSVGTSSGKSYRPSTIGVNSGKFYFEGVITIGTAGAIGVCIEGGSLADSMGKDDFSWAYHTGGTVRHNNSNASYGASYTTNDIIGAAVDIDNGTIVFFKNGASQGSYSIVGFSPDTYFLGAGDSTTGSSTGWVLNFGSDSSFAGSKTPQGNSDANGIGDYYYQPPSGFLSLCTKSLPSVDVIPTDNFNTVLYTGNGSNQSITTGLPADLVWVKSRSSGAYYNTLFDTMRGTLKRLFSNTNGAEDTEANTLTAFNSNGFTLGSQAGQNASGVTYASWNWKAGGATPSKTYAVTVVSDSGNKYRLDGFGTSAVTLNLQEGGTYTFNYPAAHPFRFSTTANGTHGGGSEYTTGVTHISSTQTKIVVAASAPALYYYCSVHSGMGGAVNTNAAFGSSNFSGSTISTVSNNVAAGFSIVTYTGTGSNATVGHGLSKAPNMSWIKPRNFADNWIVTYDAVDGSDDQAYLNTTNAGNSPAAQYTVSQNATTLGLTSWNNVNDANDTYVAYCFHNVEGYLKVGKYIGNNNADGTFVHLGFKAKFILIKEIVTGTGNGEWQIFDTARSTTNVVDDLIAASTSGAESVGNTYQMLDILSNGFKLRSAYGTSSQINYTTTYIYLAFAENPFKHSNAR